MTIFFKNKSYLYIIILGLFIALIIDYIMRRFILK